MSIRNAIVRFVQCTYRTLVQYKSEPRLDEKSHGAEYRVAHYSALALDGRSDNQTREFLAAGRVVACTRRFGGRVR